jgi:signal transduction histidine kinase
LREQSLDRWFRTFFESSRDAFAIFDAEGMIVAANPAGEALLGRGPREIGTIPGCHPGGPVAIEATPFESEGRPLTLARLSERTPAILRPEFLAMLTHELRTPLQAILGWTQLLASAPRDPETNQQLLDAIERNVHWQARVVEDLLEMSRISAADLHLELRATSAAAIVASAAERIAHDARAKGIRLARRFTADRDEIRADPDRLADAIRRLLFDALGFTAAGGEVEVHLDRVGGATIRIAVTDGGDGDDPASSHASGWFRRSGAGAATDFGLFGVGLSIVQRVVEMHGGSVGAESAGPGRGATFFMTLPLASAG